MQNCLGRILIREAWIGGLETHLIVGCRFAQLMGNTFEMAKMNIRINGKNFEDMDADEQGM